MWIMATTKAWPVSHQKLKVTRAKTIMVGTKTAATWSASRWMGALEPWAWRTSLTIWARAVSTPTPVARTLSNPCWLTVAPNTLAPVALSIGMDSPVSIASSTAEAPDTTTPSTGSRSPGLTTTTWPDRTVLAGRSRTWPSSPSTWASLGARSMSLRMAAEVWPLARTSKSLPSLIRVMITALVSK